MSNTIAISIVGDASRFNRAAGDVSSRLKHLGGSFSGVGKIAAGVFGGALITRGFDAITKGIGGAIREAQESIKVGKLTNAVLKSTGGVAGVTAGHIGGLADKLSNLTGIDDEVIQGGENLLLTFTNIRNEVGKGNDIFDQATSTITDMSVALGQDTKASAIQLGKALNDPIKGVTALQRVGVSFTAKQKEQIKTLVDSGRTLDAQKLILKELGKEFGGAAEAAATPLDKLKVRIGNIEEAIGKKLLPVINKVITLGAAFGEAIGAGFGGGKLFKEADGIVGIFQRVGEAIRGVFEFFKGDTFGAGANLAAAFGIEGPGVAKVMKTLQRIREVIGDVLGFIQRNWKPILIAAGAVLLGITSPILAVVAGLAVLYLKFQAVRDVVDSVTKFIGQQVADMVTWVQANLASFQEAFQHIANVVGALWGEFGDEIIAVVTAVFQNVQATIAGALEIIRGVIQVVTALINGDWGKAWDGVKMIFEGVWKIIVGSVMLFLTQIRALFTAALGALVALIGDRLAAVVSFFAALPGRILKTLAGLALLLVAKGIEIVTGLLRGIVNKAQDLFGYFASIPGKVISFLGDAGHWLFDIGRKILTGLVDGAKSALGGVKDFFTGIAGKITSWKGPLEYDKTILRPAGVAIMDGLIAGVKQGMQPLQKTMGDVTDILRGPSVKPAITNDILNLVSSSGFDLQKGGLGARLRRTIKGFGTPDALAQRMAKVLGFAKDEDPTVRLRQILPKLLKEQGGDLANLSKNIVNLLGAGGHLDPSEGFLDYRKVLGLVRARYSGGSLAVRVGSQLGFQEDDPRMQRLFDIIAAHLRPGLTVHNLNAMDMNDAMRKLRLEQQRADALSGAITGVA